MHATPSVRLVSVYHYCSHVTLSHSFSLMPYPAFQSVAAVHFTPQRSPSTGFPTTTVMVSLARDVSTRLGAFQPAVARCNHAVQVPADRSSIPDTLLATALGSSRSPAECYSSRLRRPERDANSPRLSSRAVTLIQLHIL
jgi:hypothetical protein